MKHGTQYAKLVKQAFNKLVKAHGKPEQGELTEPIEQMLIGILSGGTTQGEAEAALARIDASVVDRNELRVAAPRELLVPMGKQFPRAMSKARAINGMLNAIFSREHQLDLMELRGKSRRDAKEYLQTLDGMDPYSVASTMLLSIGGHAVPVDDLMLAWMRQEDLVEPDADVSEVQAFLERNISAADAYAFYMLVREHAATSVKLDASAKKKATNATKKPAGSTAKKSTKAATKKTAAKKKTTKKSAGKTVKKAATKKTAKKTSKAK